jgi:hypothetical protein
MSKPRKPLNERLSTLYSSIVSSLYTARMTERERQLFPDLAKELDGLRDTVVSSHQRAVSHLHRNWYPGRKGLSQ